MELEFVRRIEINNSSYTRKKIDDGQFWAVLPCFPQLLFKTLYGTANEFPKTLALKKLKK